MDTVTDSNGDTATDSMIFTVANVPPTLVLSGSPQVNEGTPYLLSLGPVRDPGTDTVTDYVVNWGDGATETWTAPALASANRQVTHIYADGTVNRTISVDLIDEDGTHMS